MTRLADLAISANIIPGTFDLRRQFLLMTAQTNVWLCLCLLLQAYQGLSGVIYSFNIKWVNLLDLGSSFCFYGLEPAFVYLHGV
jgi:hypothetical protein